MKDVGRGNEFILAIGIRDVPLGLGQCWKQGSDKVVDAFDETSHFTNCMLEQSGVNFDATLGKNMTC